ncbi:MAG: hypothetical protein E6G44_06670 [Actinobacteria bacterium]|nr:MAG: hypothetical protein E6G44_06670 [Actinomycetota bacterium]
MLSPALLADLYPRSGRPDDFTKAPLGEDARRIAEVVLLSGPTSTAALREELGLDGKKGQARFSRALAELGRHLVVTNFGVEDHGPGWPAAVLELTARAFAVPSSGRPGERRLAAARTFLQTTLSCRDADVARAFAWTRRDARAQLEDLVARDEATSEDGLYRPARRRRR